LKRLFFATLFARKTFKKNFQEIVAKKVDGKVTRKKFIEKITSKNLAI
jgi:hypothetical protein